MELVWMIFVIVVVDATGVFVFTVVVFVFVLLVAVAVTPTEPMSTIIHDVVVDLHLVATNHIWWHSKQLPISNK